MLQVVNLFIWILVVGEIILTKCSVTLFCNVLEILDLEGNGII